MLIEICKVKPGGTIYFHGKPCIVLEHFEDGTLVICKNSIKRAFGKTNNFAESELREYLNGAFLKELLTDEIVSEVIDEQKIDYGEIVQREIDLKAFIGNGSYGEIFEKIAPLTFYEWQKYEYIIPFLKDSVEIFCTPYDLIMQDGVIGFNFFSCIDSTKLYKVANLIVKNIYSVRPAFKIRKNCQVEFYLA